MDRSPTAPDGTPVEVRPILLEELEHVPLRCWKDRASIRGLFESQQTIGMAAWAEEKCVGQLHGYRLHLPEGGHEHWGEWNKPWWVRNRPAELDLTGPVWAHACCHVGRTLQTWLTESVGYIKELGPKCNWDAERISERHQPHCFSNEQLRELIDRARRPEQPTDLEWGADPSYFGRGIGTAMCRASIDWAKEHGYVAVLATATPDGLPTFSRLAGGLPRNSYERLGRLLPCH